MPEPTAPDLVILSESAPLSILYSSCVDRGITDGRHWSKLTWKLVATLMKPTHAGYGFYGDLK